MFRQDDRSHSYQESLSFALSGQSVSYTKVFGIVLENVTQFSVAKHINIRILISWGSGEQLVKAPAFEVPPRTEGWKAERHLLINEYPAVFTFKDLNLAALYGHPEEWSGFKFTLYEKWNGFFRLSYSITSVDPFTENTGELSIRIS